MAESRQSEWTCDEVLQLITEYGKRPALWNPDSIDNKNRYLKHQKWLELAGIFKCSKLEVERKMKILNSQYRRERLKAMKMRKLGKVHIITWYGYNAFSFMNKQKCLARYKNRSNLLMGRSAVKEEVDDHETNFGATGTKFLDDDGHGQEENEDVDTNPFENKDETLEDINQGDESHISQSKEAVLKVLYDSKDEWTLFGELVAHSLRKLPDLSRCIAKHKINTVLYEAELVTYENNSDRTVK